jgi:hypothetical protein
LFHAKCQITQIVDGSFSYRRCWIELSSCFKNWRWIFLFPLCNKYEHLLGILFDWPQLLSYKCDKLALVVEYLTSIGLTLKEIEKLVTKYPKILNRDVSKDLHPTIMLLENLGISLKDAKRIVVKDPIVFTYKAKKKLGSLWNTYNRLESKENTLAASWYGDLFYLIVMWKRILVQIGDYLKSINVSTNDIDKIVISFPWLFCYDFE